jgi:hydroxypyruvate isomerase
LLKKTSINKIKQSVPDWCFFDETINPENYYANVKKIGFTGVEMVSADRRDAARNAGLELVNNGASGMQLGLNDLNNHQQLIPEICRTIEEAKRDKISQVIIFSGNANGQSKRDGIQNCIKGIKRILPIAEKNGVILVFEMLNSYDHPDYHADSSSYGFEIVKYFQSQNLKILYDIYHMFRMNEDVVADIIANINYIAHIHIAGVPNRTNPAFENDIDYKKVITAIRNAGYNGFLGHEYVVTSDPWEELKQGYNFLI